MKLLARAVAIAAALSLCAPYALADVKAAGDTSPATNFSAQAVVDPATGKSVFGSTAWSESTVTVTGATWTLVAAANTSRRKLIISDATGLACAWSIVASPISGEGVAFSTSSSPGSWVLDEPVVNNAVYVKCASGGVVTVVAV